MANKANIEMEQHSPVPRIRTDLEIIPTSYQGQRALLVRDSLGLIRNPVLLQGDALSLVSLIDGKRTARDIQVELVRVKKGMLVDLSQVERMVAELDAAFLLQSHFYHREKERLVSEYARLEVREPSHAGLSYPADPEELRRYLGSILESSGGEEESSARGQVCALVAPHIDLETGKRVYAKAYRAIRERRCRRVFLLGTGHSQDDGFFCLTEKHFQTPLGLVKTDREVVQKLKKAGGPAVGRSDIFHRREHSLEFQVLFLQHLFGDSFVIVPILCGSFAAELGRVSRPSGIKNVAPFVRALRQCWDEAREGSFFVAGVDFSHVGPKFGHRERAASLILEARHHDRKLLEALTRGDAKAFWAESWKARDKYNICGFSSLALLLDVFPGARGRVLDYEFWQEEATQSAVSFAAAVLDVS
ncbi:MAG: AmmeMemoRadiSam system protein B [Candidatus Aminicenantes bacterium]|nr:AmmeMemoRadiSam system protein B [Candidatus Aminicenantes bacterium]